MEDGKPAKRGWARARELDKAAERDRKDLVTTLLASLGRVPSAVDIIAVESLSAAFITARRKRAAGRSDTEALKLVCQLLRATGLRPAPPATPAGPSLDATLAAIAAEAVDDTEAVDE